MASPLDTASSLLWWSNVLYVVGAVLTLGTSAMVLFEKRQIGKGIEVKHSVRNEIFFVASALICLAGTCGAIYFGGRVSAIKDADLAAYKVSANAQIAKAQGDAATANQKAADANKSAADANLTNTKLQVALANHETSEKKAESELTAKNQQLATFTQGLAQQQQGIEQHMQAAPPRLSDAQIKFISDQLKPYAGANIQIHTVMDIPSQRLANQIGTALQRAGLTTSGSSTMVGADYRGVMIIVHSPSPAPHPPIADTLFSAFTSIGIIPHTGAFPQGGPKEDEVWVCVGPE